jgi:hypothetical protein
MDNATWAIPSSAQITPLRLRTGPRIYCTMVNPWVRKLPRQVDSFRLEFPRRPALPQKRCRKIPLRMSASEIGEMTLSTLKRGSRLRWRNEGFAAVAVICPIWTVIAHLARTRRLSILPIAVTRPTFLLSGVRSRTIGRRG